MFDSSGDRGPPCGVPCLGCVSNPTGHHSNPQVPANQGQSLEVLKQVRRRDDVLLLLLLGPDGSRRLLPVEWTDALPGDAPGQPGTGHQLLAGPHDLLHLRALVDALLARSEAEPSLTAVCTTRSRIVGMPSDRSPPPGFGIVTRRTACGLYVLPRSSSRSPDNHSSSPDASIISKLCPSTPGAPLLDRANR